MQKIFYQPRGYWFGDCMPFYKDGVFYLYHQRDSRKHGSLNDPFGWSLVTTRDFVHFEDHGEVLVRGDGEDAVDQYIYAGSVVGTPDGALALYTGHNRRAKLERRTSEVLLTAHSQDLLHWKKDGQASELVPQEGYDHNDWRDPTVVWDAQRKKYILVLGARLPGDKKKPTGRLVYFESDTLDNWQFKGDFWASDEYNMVEMPKIFHLGEKWYLIFSEYCDGKVTRYRWSDSLYGPWRTPKDDLFDGKAYYAARIVGDESAGRYLSGWVATKTDNDDMQIYDWGGAFVPHQVYQQSDGSLGVKCPDSIIDHFEKTKSLRAEKEHSSDGRAEKRLIADSEDCFALSFDVSLGENTKEWQLKLFEDPETLSAYTYRFLSRKQKVTFSKTPQYPWPQYFDKGLERECHLESGKTYHVQLIVDDDMSVLYVDGVALSARMYAKPGKAISISVTEGNLRVDNILYRIGYEAGF